MHIEQTVEKYNISLLKFELLQYANEMRIAYTYINKCKILDIDNECITFMVLSAVDSNAIGLKFSINLEELHKFDNC